MLFDSQVTPAVLLKMVAKHISFIKKAHKILFPQRSGRPLEGEEVRSNRVLVSLTNTDLSHANKIKPEDEPLAAHVYFFYKLGIAARGRENEK